VIRGFGRRLRESGKFYRGWISTRKTTIRENSLVAVHG